MTMLRRAPVFVVHVLNAWGDGERGQGGAAVGAAGVDGGDGLDFDLR